MVGITHHTKAFVQLNDEGIDIGRVPKLSHNEEHDIDDAGIPLVKISGHTKTAHDALLIVPGDHASAHENGGGDELSVAGLSGVLADAQTPATHGNEAHSEEFITVDDLPSPSGGGAGARGRDGAGFVNNMLTLWNPQDGDIPNGFEVVETGVLGNYSLIKFIGGEKENMNITHSIMYDVGTNTKLSIEVYGNSIVSDIAGASTPIFIPLSTPTDTPILMTIANTTGGDINVTITATDPESYNDFVNVVLPITNSGDNHITFVLPKACNILVTL